MASFFERIANRFRKGLSRSESSQQLRDGRTESAYSASDASGRSLSNDYTELRQGNVLCPSCKGTGWIPRELEETLVALIPFNDERLKPKRTVLWVSLGVGIVFVIAAVAIFMLIPRSVELFPNRAAIDLIHVVSHQKEPPSIKLHFMNFVNVANHNYYGIQIVNTTANVISKFQPWSSDVIGKGINATSVWVAPLSTQDNKLFFNNSVTLTDVVAEYCQAPFSRLTSLYVNMQFDVVAMLEYFNHKEQVTLSTTQQVCCVPSGNCTSS